jgi:hypothetical protein
VILIYIKALILHQTSALPFTAGAIRLEKAGAVRLLCGGQIDIIARLIEAPGAFEAIESLVIGRDGLYAEQVFPHLVYRTPA